MSRRHRRTDHQIDAIVKIAVIGIAIVALGLGALEISGNGL